MEKNQNKKQYQFLEEAILDRIQFRAKVDEVVWLVSRESHLVPLKEERLEYLYGEQEMVKKMLYSFREDGVNRMESIIEQIRNYKPADLKTYNHIIFFIQTSKEYPLVISELSQLQDLNIMFSSTAEILWGLGTNDTLDDRIFFTLVCSK